MDQAVCLGRNNPVLIYQYRGNPNSVRTDGTLNPYPYNAANPGIPGVNYVIQTSVRRLNDTFHKVRFRRSWPRCSRGQGLLCEIDAAAYDTDGKMVTPRNLGSLYHAKNSTNQRHLPIIRRCRCLPFRLDFTRSNHPCGLISMTLTVDVSTDPALGNPVITKNMAVDALRTFFITQLLTHHEKSFISPLIAKG